MLYLMYARPWVRIRLHSHCRQQQLTATIRTRHLSLSQFRETQNFSDERLLGDDTDELVEADAEPELAQAGEERRKDRKKEGKEKSKKRKKKRRREGGGGRRGRCRRRCLAKAGRWADRRRSVRSLVEAGLQGQHKALHSVAIVSPAQPAGIRAGWVQAIQPPSLGKGDSLDSAAGEAEQNATSPLLSVVVPRCSVAVLPSTRTRARAHM